MDIGDIRPREVIEIEDDKDQVLTSPIVQASGSQMQDQQVASSSSQSIDQASISNQVQVLQPTNIARYHSLDSIIGDISRGVQTRSRLCNTLKIAPFEIERN